MDLEKLVSGVSPNLLVFIGTTLIAFIGWIAKSLVESPIIDSKNTFNKYVDKRIELLSEIRTRLSLIAYFPIGKENKEYKQQIQDILLKDGRSVYLNKTTFDSVLKISIDPVTNEELLKTTIREIEDDLLSQISKIRDEINFYLKFSNIHPFKKMLGLSMLVFQYVLAVSILFVFFGLVIFLIYKIIL